jgi:hypothetical protein
MMGVVDQRHQVGDGELQLVHPQPAGLLARSKAEPSAKVEQDVGGLRDHQRAGLEEGRRKRRALDAPAVDQLHHRGNAALACAARDVDIVGARLLQGEAHKLPAPLDRRPVVELVTHGSP